MEITINSVSATFRVTDVNGNPVPNLIVSPKYADDVVHDIVAGGTVILGVSVQNANNGPFTVSDIVPRLQSGPAILSEASALFDVPVGTADGEILCRARADARLGTVNSVYILDLVVEAA